MVVELAFTVERKGVTKRTHGKIMRRLNRQAMTRIRFEFLPRHFRSNSYTRPGGEYGYAARGRKYQLAKAKQKGHQKPLVYSGRMQITMMSSARITATQQGGKLYLRNYYAMTVQRRAEVERMANAEREAIRARFERDYARMAAMPEYQVQRRRSR